MKKADYSFQNRDVRRLMAALRRMRRVLYVLPTAGGKTHVAVRVALAELRKRGRVLVVVHRRELVGQAVERFTEAGLDPNRIGYIMAGEPTNSDAPVQVASIDTLRRRSHPRATLLVLDEAHHAPAKKWRGVIALYPKARVLGLTATAIRLDGKGLGGDLFREMVAGPDVGALHALGVLAIARCFSIDPDRIAKGLQKVPTVGGDYDRKAASKFMRRSILVGSYVREYLRLGRDQRAVVYAVDLKHARAIMAAFKGKGISVGYLDGATPVDARAKVLDDLRAGRIRVLVNCEILTEGWNCPPAKVCILARPTKSCGLYLQMVGRFLRPWRGVQPIVLDHAGNVLRHGLPEYGRVVTLEDGLGKPEKGERLCWACRECGSTQGFDADACEGCGAARPEHERRMPLRAKGKLVEVAPTAEEKAAALEVIKRIAAERKAPNDWVMKVYRARFGEAA